MEQPNQPTAEQPTQGQKEATMEAIAYAVAHTDKLPKCREAALVKTKLEEAALWLTKVAVS
jgi:hypothetical protein